MIKPKIGFIVCGVHKDGLLDPMGTPFIDDKLIANAKKSLVDAGLEPPLGWFHRLGVR